MAPAQGLSKETREAMFADSLRLTGAAKYLCAGTVEFLVDKAGRHFFIEVNPRVQVCVFLTSFPPSLPPSLLAVPFLTPFPVLFPFPPSLPACLLCYFSSPLSSHPLYTHARRWSTQSRRR
jgi:hypothetical protein